MVIQTGYFDDSGSDAGSEWYVLAGFIAPDHAWTTVAESWSKTIAKEPGIRYFKMSEAMAMEGQFRTGWTTPLRNQLIMELVDIIEQINPARIECFLKQSDFNSFVGGIVEGNSFNNPYFLLFYHLILSVAANATKGLGWSRECNFIFDEQGRLGTNAVEKWNWMKQNIDGENAANVAGYLGSEPKFCNDLKSVQLQAADMFAWLVRDCVTKRGKIEDISRAAIKYLEGRRILRIQIDRDLLMKLGASFMVGKAKLHGHL
jgi:hypothetical protein